MNFGRIFFGSNIQHKLNKVKAAMILGLTIHFRGFECVGLSFEVIMQMFGG